MMQAVYIDNDNLLRLSGVKNTATGGTYIGDANPVATLHELDGSQIGGTITMSVVDAATGTYEGVIDAATAIVVWREYEVRVVITTPLDAVWWVRATAVRRETS